MNRLKQQLDMVKASPSTKEKTMAYVIAKRKKSRMPAYAVSALALCCFILLLLQPWSTSSAVQSYVTLDINPSMEFTLNEQDKIVAVTTFNQEAKTLLEGQDLQGMKVEEAFTYLWQKPEWIPYLSNGIVEVSVYSEDRSVSLRLEKELNAYLSTSLEEGSYHCSHVGDDIYEQAQDHHASMGKYRVIEEIRSYTQVYSEEELLNKSMKELYQILEPYDASALPSGCDMQKENGHGHHDH